MNRGFRGRGGETTGQKASIGWSLLFGGSGLRGGKITDWGRFIKQTITISEKKRYLKKREGREGKRAFSRLYVPWPFKGRNHKEELPRERAVCCVKKSHQIYSQYRKNGEAAPGDVSMRIPLDGGEGGAHWRKIHMRADAACSARQDRVENFRWPRKKDTSNIMAQAGRILARRQIRSEGHALSMVASAEKKKNRRGEIEVK